MWQVRQLEAFRAVMTTGNMTRAAESLCITQPAISKLIAALEDKCGFALFQRKGNQLLPTTEAELLYAEVQRIMLGTYEIKRKAEEIREKRFGSLSIAAFPALATRVLPVIITRFRANHPNVQVLLTGRNSVFMTNWLSAQRVDLGISVVRLNQPDMHSERVLSMEAVCVLPPDHVLTQYSVLNAQQIATQPLISLTSEDTGRTRVDRYFETANLRPSIAVEAQLSESACQFVVNGAGISIVEPLSTLGFSERQLTVRRITPRIYFDVWITIPANRKPSLITTEFIAFFSSSLKAILDDAKFHYR